GRLAGLTRKSQRLLVRAEVVARFGMRQRRWKAERPPAPRRIRRQPIIPALTRDKLGCFKNLITRVDRTRDRVSGTMGPSGRFELPPGRDEVVTDRHPFQSGGLRFRNG